MCDNFIRYIIYLAYMHQFNDNIQILQTNIYYSIPYIRCLKMDKL